MIGSEIKKFRIQKGMTQEELGQLVGVTTQAVSKWERGGVPDAEILPNIADALGVSVDALFGRTDSKSLEEIITTKLSSMNRDDGFQKAFSLCWAIEMGLTGQNSLKDKFTPEMLDTLDDKYGHQYYSKLMFDEGLVNAKVSKNSRYFFLMPEPENGYRNYFNSIDELSETFALLGDKDILKIIFYMYQRKNTPVALSMIALNTEMTFDRTEKLMDKLCRCNLTDCVVIETENGNIKAYTFRQECAVVPLFCYAKEIRDTKMLDFVALFNRTKPLF